MKHELEAYHEELQTCCHNIIAFIGTLTVSEYSANALVKAAVERQFEIIGEVLSRMSREYPLSYAQIRNARKIIDFRNLLSHGMM